MAPVAPIYIVDIAGSAAAIVLSFLALGVMRRITRARQGFGLYSYLYLQTIALCIFAVSRSAGHIAKHIFLTLGHSGTWKAISPVSGSINSFTFIVFALAALMYANIKRASDEVDALEQSRTRLREAKESVERSLGEKHVLLKEVHHRVKNNMAVITSLLDMQMMVLGEGAAASVLRECKQRVKSMALVHEKLYKAEDFLEISIKDYIDALILDIMQSYHVDGINKRFDIQNVRLSLNQLIPIGLIINEIVSNSVKHAYAGVSEPELYISLHEGDGRVRLEVADNGPGMGPDARGDKKTLGVHIISALVGQLSGDVEKFSDGGTRYIIQFDLEGGSR